jgi:hypothetical protein
MTNQAVCCRGAETMEAPVSVKVWDMSLGNFEYT